jgi:hypothetical protein
MLDDEQRESWPGAESDMNAGAEPRQRMPIRLPATDVVRQRIAEVAAQQSGGSSDHYLSLLGTIEPVLVFQDGGGTAWRLSAYWGSYSEGDAIERAVDSVRRIYPFVSG